MRIGLMEDDVLRRTIYGRHLGTLGHDVVDWGPACEPRAITAPLDALVLDLARERLALEDSIRQLKRHFRDQPSILLLSSEQELKAADALSSGVYAVIREPIHLEELEFHLTRLAKARRREKGNRRQQAAQTADRG